VIDDPCWDSQVESRDDYYARLLLALAADLGPIAARLVALAEDAPPAESPPFTTTGTNAGSAASGSVIRAAHRSILWLARKQRKAWVLCW
jgi:hypothetical protein